MEKKEAIIVISFFLTAFLLFIINFFLPNPISSILSNFYIDLTIPSLIITFFSVFIAIGWMFYLVIGFVSILIFPLRNKSFRKNIREMNSPLVSIIICARNEEKVIKNILLDIIGQKYSNWEAIVVAHNCIDNTYQVANSIKDERIKIVIYNEGYGKPIALNYGIKFTKGEIVVVFDADSRIKSSCLEQFLPYFQKYDAVQMRIVTSNKEKFLPSIQDLEWLCYTDITEQAVNSLGFALLGGTGQGIKRKILEKVGFWDEKNLVEDFDLSLSLIEDGYKIGFAYDVQVYDEKPQTIKAIFKQRARWLRGNFQTFKKHFFRSLKMPKILHLLLSYLQIFLFYYGLVLMILYLLGGTYKIIYNPFWLEMWIFQIILLWLRAVLERGLKGFILFPLFLLYTYHWYMVMLYIPKVKTWKESKTEHYGSESFK